jgi:pyruvate,water dikinase
MFADLFPPVFAEGFKRTTARYGVPLSHVDMRIVNHHPYARPRAVGAPEKATSPPPAAVLRLLARVHPAMRRRGRAARRTFDQRLWRDDLRTWSETSKPQLVARCQALQAEALAALDDAALADHIDRAVALYRDGNVEHFALALADAIPVGDFLVASQNWGIDSAEALALLAGSSPTSAGTRAGLARIADALRDAGVRPVRLEDVYDASTAAATALDAYLDEFGWRVVENFDINGRCLVELPELIVQSLLAVLDGRTDQPTADDAAIRARVPAPERARFDELLAEARAMYGLRDDNTAVTQSWTSGLLRRAALEAAGRLVAAGRMLDPAHAFDATARELAALLRGAASPSGDDIAARARDRAAAEREGAPDTLGPPEGAPPSPDLFPRAMGRAMRAVAMYMDHAQPHWSGITGAVGVGTEIYRGTARVVHDADDALVRLEPGDVLVAALTSPAYNAVLPIVGALVVEEGGALSHAAIVAREFGVPAVIGLRGATETIPDGAKVEVDPLAATVIVL